MKTWRVISPLLGYVNAPSDLEQGSLGTSPIADTMQPFTVFITSLVETTAGKDALDESASGAVKANVVAENGNEPGLA